MLIIASAVMFALGFFQHVFAWSGNAVVNPTSFLFLGLFFWVISGTQSVMNIWPRRKNE